MCVSQVPHVWRCGTCLVHLQFMRRTTESPNGAERSCRAEWQALREFGNMDHASAALEHLRLMEVRIEHQTELITRLKCSGEDTLEASQKLVLLRRALEE